jgi:hypothetical protein
VGCSFSPQRGPTAPTRTRRRAAAPPRVLLSSRLQPRCQLLLLPLLQVRALQAAREDADRATADAHVLSQRLRQV